MDFYNNSIFWIETEKIKPNPVQPRKEFDEARLNDLAMSIRQYGILQPLVVTRKEIQREDGSLYSEYELISGERRLRASRLAGLTQVPAIIKIGDETDKMKLELAIIENLQREDLNPVDRAKAFKQLSEDFKLTHLEIAKKVGKSREYVSNSIRILMLPEEMIQALSQGRITEGHTRPILMLIDKKEEQMVLFKEIMQKKMTVREAEAIARRIAFEKARKHSTMVDPELFEIEEKLTEALGTRVHIERKTGGAGKIHIDYFSNTDLHSILSLVKKNFDTKTQGDAIGVVVPTPTEELGGNIATLPSGSLVESHSLPKDEEKAMIEDKPLEEIKKEEEDESYNMDNFTV